MFLFLICCCPSFGCARRQNVSILAGSCLVHSFLTKKSQVQNTEDHFGINTECRKGSVGIGHNGCLWRRTSYRLRFWNEMKTYSLYLFYSGSPTFWFQESFILLKLIEDHKAHLLMRAIRNETVKFKKYSCLNLL